jgi:hypothetical protein
MTTHKDLYALRDLIADAIMDYEAKHQGHTVVLLQQYEDDGPRVATIGQIAIETVDQDGAITATTYRSTKSTRRPT